MEDLDCIAFTKGVSVSTVGSGAYFKDLGWVHLYRLGLW